MMDGSAARPEPAMAAPASAGGSCCDTMPASAPTPPTSGTAAHAETDETDRVVDFTAYVKTDTDGRASLHLLVEGATCGGCVNKIERRLAAFPEIEHGRLNLTTKRLVMRWRGAPEHGVTYARAVADLGFRVMPFDPDRLQAGENREERTLLRAMAVAGFAAGNVMLLSISVWAGHAQGMGEATRSLLHWFSALIALPTIAYAARPFFDSAWRALKTGHTNMDVPISLAVLLAAGMSLFETMRGGPHVYFDSAVTLVFFLLVSRFLDRRARGKARSAAERLLALRSGAVTVIDADGTQRLLPGEQVREGMTVAVAAGEKVGVDGELIDGRSDIDMSLISGETTPQAVGPGDRVFAGTLNKTGPIKLRVTAVGERTLLSEIVGLMELAEQRKAAFVGIADRLARLYAPVVHGLALAAFLGWTVLGGLAWQDSLMIAVAVLIITCPCALGLAVPAVQVIATGWLMRRGVLLKSATALERLTKVDLVVFDKTGTLTTGRAQLVPTPNQNADTLADTLLGPARLAAASRHPLARALARAVPGAAALDGAREEPGRGMIHVTCCGKESRLGSHSWVLGRDAAAAGAGTDRDDTAAPRSDGPEIWYRKGNQPAVRFCFLDPPRPDAAAVVAALKRQGIGVALLSGDRPGTVAQIARSIGIDDYAGGASPQDKVARLQALAAEGRHVLMVGDGLNDAPALAAASVSASPTSATDISQTAADAVFQGDRLTPVLDLLAVAKRADQLVRQNFALSFGYNALAVPLAVAGLVTPLIAAVFMSASSLVVVGNALRINWMRGSA